MGPQQTVLSSAGAEAHSTALLSWVMFGGAAAIFVVVMTITALAYAGSSALRGKLSTNAFIIGAGAVFPVVSLTALLVYGLMLTGAGVGTRSGALRIEIVGEQWWWRVNYPASTDAPGIVTANEIRIPVGSHVEIALSSADVIHSFWVPNLAGKVDMIPGVVNRIRLRASTAGVYRGQCAEYCGGPHALMAFHVVALEPEEFRAWVERQRQPAVAPATMVLREGAALFVSLGCNACHAVRGTSASGTIGPDLTHAGGRLSIGAATLPNDQHSFARWIRDNQHIKPNNRMPPFGILTDAELTSVAAYLESLQ